jgi:hypothetical protein
MPLTINDLIAVLAHRWPLTIGFWSAGPTAGSRACGSPQQKNRFKPGVHLEERTRSRSVEYDRARTVWRTRSGRRVNETR